MSGIAREEAAAWAAGSSKEAGPKTQELPVARALSLKNLS
jgi:hypothetical protein